MKKLTALVPLLLLFGFDTWGPYWSELTGSRYNDMASMTDGPVVVNQVDGATPSLSQWNTIKLTSGPHKLVLQGVPPAPVMGQINFEETEVDFKPCVRYYINARFASSTGTKWGPFIDHEEPIADCKAPAPAPAPAKTN